MTDHSPFAAVPESAPTRIPPARAEVTVQTGVPAAPVEPAEPAQRSIWKLLLTIVALATMSGLFLFFPIDWEKVGNWGYVGVFVVTFIATASFILPIPYLFIVARAALYLDPIGVTLVAGLAGALGEMTGYVLGASGRTLIPQGKLFEKANYWMIEYGFLCVVFFAFIPNPIFDAIGFAAGVLRYPAWKFILACFIGKSMKFGLAAFSGPMVIFTCKFFPHACAWFPHTSRGLFGG
ncbi:MAG: YqaA family protein [Chloroflexota bacterium]